MAREDCEFVLLYCDYALSCRELGVQPLTLDALRQRIATPTERRSLLSIDEAYGQTKAPPKRGQLLMRNRLPLAAREAETGEANP